ncbi:MAG TPA: integrase core domain-containing protein, partial [Terriglobia bacterium]
TVTFRVLYCFFVIEHERRKILHCNVTEHPTAEWIVQQLREAFPEPCRYRYVILDRDRKFEGEVIGFLKTAGLEPKRTRVQAPWQNGMAERWIGSCRREILDHVIPLNRDHLRRILRDYVTYHEADRLHDSLAKDAPNGRAVEQRPGNSTIAMRGAKPRRWGRAFFTLAPKQSQRAVRLKPTETPQILS